MPRELPAYRDNLELLNEKFDYNLLTRKDLVTFTGKSKNTVVKLFPFEGLYISKANFARMLARMGATE